MWQPVFGALPVEGGVRFRVMAAPTAELRLVLHGGPAAGEHAMLEADGVFELTVPGVAPGQRYSYRINGSDPRPDPASRFQPEGVHGPSEVIDPSAFEWHDDAWQGVAPHELIVYELHVGTFSGAGTFASAGDRLQALRDLGVTAIEIMPVAEFPGCRNWGYDGVALFAPSRTYGRPEDLRALVDRAHQLGLAVMLDVVYNHLGPEGAYLPQFYPQYLHDRHHTPWGSAVNLDGPGSTHVRRFITDNAVHWVREYHIDGLRLDATHALIDDSPSHFVRELAATVRLAAGRPVAIHAEDHRNLADIVRDEDPRAWGLDAVWADDFHHVVRRIVAGDSHGYYADYRGTTAELARTVQQGWLYTGEYSGHLGTPRGTDPSAVPMSRFVVCLQNHDQIGNRALGERLHHQVDDATWRAVSVLLLTVPMTPLLFMGQEWSARTPFQFFTDLEPALGPLVTVGRRDEFRHFPEFSESSARGRIPDPQAQETFDRSRLQWAERDEPQQAAVLALYRALLELRRSEPALGGSSAMSGEAFAPDEHSVLIRRTGNGEVFWVVVHLRESGIVKVDCAGQPGWAGAQWRAVLTTEDTPFSLDPQPPDLDLDDEVAVVRFRRPGAVILKRALAEPELP